MSFPRIANEVKSNATATGASGSDGSADEGQKAFRFIENCWVPMPDGVKLAASLWIPVPRNDEERFPALLEVLPYRKRDHTAARDFQNHGFFARHGFAGVRIDMRGCGDSEGIFDAGKTYDDIVSVIAWLREQEWCSGAVGMVGLSWGGINAAMAAARQPPGLKAVVACSFSTDRYGVGMIWKNGCLLNENFGWSTAVASFTTRPPDPAVVGEGWRQMWLNRLENLSPPITDYLGRQRRDSYWDLHKLHDPSAIEVPILLYGGWADSNYTQTLPALMDGVSAPRRAVFGPWGHKYPHFAIPGPGRDFLGEATSWFRRWIEGKEPGQAHETETGFAAYIMQDVPAAAAYANAPGRWIEQSSWPPEGYAERILRLGDGVLSAEGGDFDLSHRSPQTVGLCSGEVMPCFNAGLEPELPGDQREDDGKSLVFDTAPLETDLETLGAPVLDLEFSVDKPVAFLAARLCEVAADGMSTRVNLGLFNLNRHESERDPAPLVPGRRYRMSLPLDFKGYLFRRGRRIRLALSTAYWPMVWPSPEPVTITVHTAGSALRLPSCDGASPTPGQIPEPPRVGPSLAKIEVTPPRRERQISYDAIADETTVRILESAGVYRLDDIDWTVESQSEEIHCVRGDDPSSASTNIKWNWRFSRGEWCVRTETEAHLSCTPETFRSILEIKAFAGDEKVFERRWEHEFPRDHL